MCLDDHAANIEAEAQSLRRALAGHAVKAFPDVLLCIAVQPWTVIAHGHSHMRVALFHQHFNGRRIVSIFQGVGQEIIEYLAEAIRVGP